jgi:hypothetical protein
MWKMPKQCAIGLAGAATIALSLSIGAVTWAWPELFRPSHYWLVALFVVGLLSLFGSFLDWGLPTGAAPIRGTSSLANHTSSAIEPFRNLHLMKLESASVSEDTTSTVETALRDLSPLSDQKSNRPRQKH